MSEKNTTKIIFVLTVILLFTPLINGGDIAFFHLRQLVFSRTIVEIIFIFYLYLVFKNTAYLPKKSLIVWAIIAFGTTYLISALFSSNTQISFWGNVQRFGGFINILHLLVFTIIASVVFKKSDFIWLFKISVLAATTISFYSLFQFFGLAGAKEQRIIGSFGNAGLLAGYLLPHAFLAFHFLIDKTNKQKINILYGIASILFSILIYITSVRGALLAIIVGYVFIFSTTLRPKLKKYLIYLASAGILAVLIFFISGAHRSTWAHKFIPGQFLNPETLSYRFRSWDTAIEGWQNKPFLGWGPENFQTVYLKYFDPPGGPENLWDKAHNIFLEWLATQGAIGLAVLLFFLIAVLISARRKNESIILNATLLAYLIHNFFFFDSLASSLVFFLIVGYVASADNEHPINTEKRLSIGNWTIIILLILATTLNIHILNIKPLTADNYFGQARFFYANKPDHSIELFKKALALNTPERFEIRRNLASLVVTKSDFYELSGIGPSENEFSFVIDQMEKNIAEDTNNVFNYLYIASLYIRHWKIYALETDLIKAGDFLTGAENLSPTNKQIKHLIAEVKYEQGDKASAEKILLNTLSEYPDSAETFWRLALMKKNSANPQKAFEYAKLADRLIYTGTREFIPDIIKLAEIYSTAGAYTDLISINNRLIKIRPDYVPPYISNAAIFKEIGDTESAIIYAKGAVEIEPSLNGQLKIFLNDL